MKEKNITTDELARMVQKGFLETVGQMTKSEKKINQRFDGIDKSLKDIHSRLTGVVFHIKEELENLLAMPMKK
ncbi:MAG: hypothetical protein COU70_00570 [Parcubacteria group bacterium CG10_big_fil_rev_8_21_14_0_10_35_15]|nr:MAG: hypothetical protein COU70_00570 [Parcubacteria group bacterium CG10_big_fil_rev_8_21_14_0_10_35_15]